MEKIYNVLLDTKDDVKNPAFVVNTNDLKTVKINLLINQDGDPLDLTGATVRLAVKKPDKTTVLQDFTVVDAVAGSCEIVLNTQAYVIDGKYDAEVMVYYGVDTVAVTGQFSYRAVKGILDDGTVESTNEWQSITQAIADNEAILDDLRTNGTGVDAEARADITTLETSLAENTQHIKDFTINVNDKQFGAKGDGVTDDTLAIQTAIDTLYAARNTVAHRTILFPSTRYKISSTLQINMAGVKFVGGGFLRPDVEGTGTRLELNTSANNGSTPIPLIQIGTNNGNPYDNADYSGYEGFSIENMLLRYYGGSRTALLNGQASSWSYGTNTYGIRDWKGGAISLKNVRIEGFEYGFWGIQSDINQWDNVYLWYNKLGAYLGPRSDQNTFTHVYTKFNDTGIHIDRSANARFFGCHFVDDGSATTPAIKIGSSYASSGSGAIAFHGCWFEHFMGADEIEAFVDIASSDTVQTLDVWFRDSIILTNDQVTAIHAKYFLKIGNATRIIVDGLNGNLNKLSKLFSFVGSTSPAVRVSLHDDQISNLFVNNGTGTPSINNWGWGYNSNKLSSQNGRLYLQRTTPNNQRDFFVSAESDKTFCVDFSSDGTGNTRRVSLERRLVGKYGAAPTTGTWDIGDIALNSNSQPGTPAAWQCTASSPLTFMPIAQAGYRTTTAAPTLTPNFIGEEVLDTTNKNWYKSVGTNSTDWKLMT